MTAFKWLAIALGAYLALVVAFEGVVGFLGKRDAESGEPPAAPFIVLTTREGGVAHDTVIAGVELDGRVYVSANHWPRAWYRRARANPEVEVTRDGERKPFRVVPVDGGERERIAARYPLPFAIRVLAGFPPRAYLRLDPR